MADGSDSSPRRRGQMLVVVFAALLGVPLLFEPLGAYGTLALFTVLLLVLISRTAVVLAGVAAVLAMAMCWYFLPQLLGFPTGPW